MSSGLFFRALQRGEAHEVAMDEVRFIAFTDQSLRSVGTRNLNGCTAVMVVSQYGAVLAHIPPRAAAARCDDPEAGDRHCGAKMDEMAAIYRSNQRFFPKDKPSWIDSALWEDETALPSQKRIIETKLREMGLNPSSANYRSVMPPQTDNYAKGTVFIDARAGGTPRVYVEDILVGGTPTSTDGEVNTLVKSESHDEVGPKAAQTASRHPQQESQQSQQSQQAQQSQQSHQDALRRVHDELTDADSHEDFVRISNNLKTSFKGQCAEYQRQFLDVVKRVRDERQRRHR